MYILCVASVCIVNEIVEINLNRTFGPYALLDLNLEPIRQKVIRGSIQLQLLRHRDNRVYSTPTRNVWSP